MLSLPSSMYSHIPYHIWQVPKGGVWSLDPISLFWPHALEFFPAYPLGAPVFMCFFLFLVQVELWPVCIGTPPKGTPKSQLLVRLMASQLYNAMLAEEELEAVWVIWGSWYCGIGLGVHEAETDPVEDDGPEDVSIWAKGLWVSLSQTTQIASKLLKNEWRLRKFSPHLTALPSSIFLFMKHGWALVSSRHIGWKFQMCHSHKARLSNWQICPACHGSQRVLNWFKWYSMPGTDYD